MKMYEIPMLSVNRLSAVRILTVSGEAEWDGNWDDALEDEGVINPNEDDA